MRTPTNAVSGNARGSRGIVKSLRAVGFLLNMGFPWTGKRNDPWAYAVRRALLTRWPTWLRPAIWPVSILVWPFVSLLKSIRIARAVSHGPIHLWLYCWIAALTRNVPPQEFVHFRLYRPGVLDNEDGGCDWRFELETANLLTQITSPEVAELVRDKRAFYKWLASLDDPPVPAPPVLDALPTTEAVTKPRYGIRGLGVTFWTPEGGMWRPRAGFGRFRQRPMVEEAVMQRIKKHDLILQPAVPPHPELRHPIVARILTVRTGAGPKASVPLNPVRPTRVKRPDGLPGPLKARAVAASAQIPATPDKASHRGPVRLVNMANGTLRREGPGMRTLVATGIPPRMPLEGATLPGWKGILAALEAAHDALEGHAPCLGWDVIWGPDGPMVLEANIGISLSVWQIDLLEPLPLPLLLPE